MKILVALLVSLGGVVSAEVTEGVLGESKYLVAAPEEWQGKVALLAHGFRPESHPLSAGFEVNGQFSTALLEQGWCIASTSYRRNGWIVEDAISDLKELRDHVSREHGEVKRCLVIGNSMGGLIATLIAEGALEGVDGVVAVGAYLGNEERNAPHALLSYQPKVPLLFLTNETELDHPVEYREKAGNGFTALWEVKRPGHCNVSDRERLNALLAIDAWVSGDPPGKNQDGTVLPPERESTARVSGNAREGKTSHVSEPWGNLLTTFVAADLDALDLEAGDPLLVKRGDAVLEATICGYRDDVPRGKAAAYITSDGWLAIAVNGGNAARELEGIGAGDELKISAKPGKTE